MNSIDLEKCRAHLTSLTEIVEILRSVAHDNPDDALAQHIKSELADVRLGRVTALLKDVVIEIDAVYNRSRG